MHALEVPVSAHKLSVGTRPEGWKGKDVPCGTDANNSNSLDSCVLAIRCCRTNDPSSLTQRMFILSCSLYQRMLSRESVPGCLWFQVPPEVTVKLQGAVFPSEDPSGRPFHVHQQDEQRVFIHCHIGTDLWPGRWRPLSSSFFSSSFQASAVAQLSSILFFLMGS